MTNRLDALSARESNGKTYWNRIGVAFQSKDGSGWNVLLDAMPAPTDGQFKITLRPPQSDSREQNISQTGGRGAPSAGAADDGIPF